MPPRRPLVVAHRGASRAAPENTIEAFDRAIADGADMVELDVRRAAGGELVVFHDPSVGGRPLAAMTRDEISDAAGRAVPLLDEAVEHLTRRVGLDMELKEEECAEDAVAVVRSTAGFADLIVTSFAPQAIVRVRRAWPQVSAGLLIDAEGTADASAARRAVAVCGATAVAPSLEVVRRDGLAWAAEAGLPVFVWTVDDPPSIAELLTCEPVTGIITNVPDVARGLRDRGPATA
jgi:glycerophosphoryl diester phosphodiesterase